MYQQLQQFTFSFVFAFVFWLLLVGSLDRQELVAGLLVAAAAGALTIGRRPVLAGFRLTPTAPLSLLGYLGSLLVALLRANIDMARRVLSPSLPIRPALVQVKTSLRSDLGRLVLANSITLTPGTLSVDVDDDTLLVHWIDCPPGTDMAAATQTIAGDFERHLRGFLQ
ncbi:MAG: Na+/H+ antiporter subunit E [Chromatiaceae bacterium]|jgi:multicomponent Na+:H+ antiporter subunit E|nr:Na+/H+ antiporter subunit E [Chromatiaceae bacterium]